MASADRAWQKEWFSAPPPPLPLRQKLLIGGILVQPFKQGAEIENPNKNFL